MAVKVTVYGTANMRQIESARKELDKLEGQARKSATGFKGAMGRMGSAVSSTGAKIASGLAAAGLAKWLKGSVDAAVKAQESQDAFKNAVMATNGVVNNSKAAREAATKATLDLNKVTTGAALAHNLAQQALKKHGRTSLEYKNAVNSAALADAKVTKYAKANKEAQYALAHAVTKTSINWDEYGAKAQKLLVAQSDVSAFSKGQLRDALTQLTTTTGDANKSLDLLQVTTDLARRKHIDLSTAAVQVGRAYNGNITSLKRIGIELPKGAKGMEVINALQKRVAGSAKSYGESAAGAQDKFRNSLKSLQVTVGTALLPSITNLMNTLAGIAKKFQSLSPNVQGIIVKIGATTAAVLLLMPYFERLGKGMKGIYNASKTAVTGLMNLVKGLRGTATAAEGQAVPKMARLGAALRRAGSASVDFVKKLALQTVELVKSAAKWVWNTTAMLANKAATFAVSAATKAMTAAQWLLNAAMSANPIGLVVLAIVAFVAVLVLAWKKSDTFRKIVIGAWNAIKNAAVAVWNGIVKVVKTVFRLLVNYATKWNLAALIITHWQQIKDGAGKALGAVINFFKNVPRRILKAVGNLGRLLLNVGADIVNGLKNGISNTWNTLVSKVKGLTNALPSVVKKILHIQSPSRVFMSIGQMVGKGMEVGILGTQKNIEAATAKVAGSALKAVQNYQSKVRTIREAIGNTMTSWGIGEMPAITSTTPDALIKAQQAQASTVQGFFENIKKLKSSTLSKSVVASLLSLGAASGAGQAAAFAAMTPDQITQYNKAYLAEKSSASSLATLQYGKPVAPKNITIAAGALKVDIHINGNASEHDVNAAVSKAFKKLTKELASK